MKSGKLFSLLILLLLVGSTVEYAYADESPNAIIPIQIHVQHLSLQLPKQDGDQGEEELSAEIVLKRLDEKRDIGRRSQFLLTTIVGNEALCQMGKRISVISGQSLQRAGFSARSSRQENVGTIVRVNSSILEGTLVLELDFEESRMEAATSDEADEALSPDIVTLTAQTNIVLKPDQRTVVGLFSKRDEAGSHGEYLVVSATWDAAEAPDVVPALRSPSSSRKPDSVDSRYRSYAEGLLRKYDTDGNGTLSAKEYAIERLGSHAEMDRNKDGQVSVEELARRFHELTPERRP